jgi:hypothetical protein
MADKEFEKVIDIFEIFGEKLIIDSKKSLQAKGHVSGGGQSGLLGSFKYRIRETKTGIIFSFSMADYGEYIDTGTRPAKKTGSGGNKMIESLNAWQTGKNINALAIYKSKLKNPSKSKVNFKKAQRSLSYAIKKNIHKKGIIKRFGYKGSRFFTSLLKDGRVQIFEKELSKEVGKSVKVIFNSTILKGKL